MAKYIVKHQCGHEEEVVLFGKESERERKLAWLREQSCKECQAKATAAANAEAGLPTPEGTEKQVRWAVELQARYLANRREIERYLAAYEQKKGKDANYNAIATALETLDGKARTANAAWWIDNRDDIAGDIYSFKATINKIIKNGNRY